MKNLKFAFCMILVFLTGINFYASGQINPLSTSYFQNRYLNNPAMAGDDAGLSISAAHRRDWNGHDGSPVNNIFTAGYRSGKMGFGVLVDAGSDGLIRNNKVVASYAYHLETNNKGQLSFGLSAGLTSNRLKTGEIIGDAADQLVIGYNDRPLYFNADAGTAYSPGNLTVQAVMLNLRQYFQDSEDNDAYLAPRFFTSVSYTFNKSGNISLEPQLAYRGFKGYDNILDAGINAAFYTNKVNLLALYHSSKSITAGLGFTISNQYMLQCTYTTSTRSSFRQYSDGNIEIGFKTTIPTRKN